MITPAIRSMVSVASLSAALIVSPVTGCVRAPAPDALQPTPRERAPHATIRFENEAQVQVDVYLVAEQREWRLGRVAPGAITLLTLPDAALTQTPGFVRLAVIAGGPMTVQAAREPRATFTIAQPAAELLSQRFTFAEGQLVSPRIIAMPRAPRER